jgi:hypothetical protein
LKNDSVINSNDIEGIPSLLPVESMVMSYHAESKVTVCHAAHGTCSSRDNIREGDDAILEVVMDDDKDFSAECRMQGSIIDSYVTERITSLPPVESMVTAYHAESKVMACHAMRL